MIEYATGWKRVLGALLHWKGNVVHKFWVMWYCGVFCSRLFYRAVIHDLSKFSWAETTGFSQVLHLLKKTHFGSPEYKEALQAIRSSIKHHHKSNPHHPEHWTGSEGLSGMSLLDMVEMICDWRASSRRSPNGNVADSAHKLQDRFHYSDETKHILLNTSRRVFDVYPTSTEESSLAPAHSFFRTCLFILTFVVIFLAAVTLPLWFRWLQSIV